jgi:hypothetical protein
VCPLGHIPKVARCFTRFHNALYHAHLSGRRSHRAASDDQGGIIFHVTISSVNPKSLTQRNIRVVSYCMNTHKHRLPPPVVPPVRRVPASI